MCKKRKQIEANFEAPIFSNLCYNKLLILSCGGGGKRFGLKNRLMVYKEQDEKIQKLEKKIFEIDTGEDLIENLNKCQKLGIIGGCADEFVVIYSIEESSGQLEEKLRIKCDYSKDGCVNSVVFSRNGELMITGSDDGILRLWKVWMEQQSNTQKLQYQLLDSKSNHIDQINKVDINFENQLVVSASQDQTCILYKIDSKNSLIFLRKLTFLVYPNSDFSFSFVKYNIQFIKKLYKEQLISECQQPKKRIIIYKYMEFRLFKQLSRQECSDCKVIR